MAKPKRILAGVLRIIPREQLNQLAKDYTSQDRPWMSERKDLELMLLSAAAVNPHVNNWIAEYIIEFLEKRLILPT